MGDCFQMTSDHKLGKDGERLASNFLEKNNFSILDKNWHSGKYGEIDIIAKDNFSKELVFIEVKTRATSTDEAKELVTKKKQQQLYKLAKSYLYLGNLGDCTCRFDVIAIRINEKGRVLEHIKNAFYLQ